MHHHVMRLPLSVLNSFDDDKLFPDNAVKALAGPQITIAKTIYKGPASVTHNYPTSGLVGLKLDVTESCWAPPWATAGRVHVRTKSINISPGLLTCLALPWLLKYVRKWPVSNNPI